MCRSYSTHGENGKQRQRVTGHTIKVKEHMKQQHVHYFISSFVASYIQRLEKKKHLIATPFNW